MTDSTFFAVLNINAKEHIIADPILDLLYRVRVGLADRLADPDFHCDHREKYVMIGFSMSFFPPLVYLMLPCTEDKEPHDYQIRWCVLCLPKVRQIYGVRGCDARL